MILICIKQQLSNIWISVYEKIKQQWGWVEKKALSIKKRVCHDNPLHNFLKIWRENWLCSCSFRDFHFLWLRFFKIFNFHFHYFALLYRFTSTMFSYRIFNFISPFWWFARSTRATTCAFLQLSLFFLFEVFWVAASRLSLCTVVLFSAHQFDAIWSDG